MKERVVFAAPIFVALALHVWASGAYAQDLFVLAVALAAIPLGGRVLARGRTAPRVLAFCFFVGGRGHRLVARSRPRLRTRDALALRLAHCGRVAPLRSLATLRPRGMDG